MRGGGGGGKEGKGSNLRILFSFVEDALAELEPMRPSTASYTQVDPSQSFTCQGITIGFDNTGAINKYKAELSAG